MTPEERQHAIADWARRTCTDPIFLYHLAKGDEAVLIIRRIIRRVAKWALINATNTADDSDWAIAEQWLNTSPATLRAQFQDNAVRGAWGTAVSANRLPKIDTATWRPETDGPNITGQMTNHQLDQHIFGW